jgi:hypothetical protein
MSLFWLPNMRKLVRVAPNIVVDKRDLPRATWKARLVIVAGILLLLGLLFAGIFGHPL